MSDWDNYEDEGAEEGYGRSIDDDLDDADYRDYLEETEYVEKDEKIEEIIKKKKNRLVWNC